MQTIKRGSKGEAVALLKDRLLALGYLQQSTHDTFGCDTEEAVRMFQSDRGLEPDGIVGAKTWAALTQENQLQLTMEEKIRAMESLLKLTVGDYYIFGGQGHELTQEYLDRQNARYPQYFTDGRHEWLTEQIAQAQRLHKKIYCTDCSGLFWWVNESVQLIPGVSDSTADGLYRRYCTPVAMEDVRAGDILFRESGGKMVHMAIVGREGTYEAAGTAYGVVCHKDVFARDVPDRMTGKTVFLKPWTHAGRLKV